MRPARMSGDFLLRVRTEATLDCTQTSESRWRRFNVEVPTPIQMNSVMIFSNCYMHRALLALVATSVSACSPPEPPSLIAADTVFTGGNIVTMDDAQPSAEAVAVLDGSIVAVGTRAGVEAQIEPGFSVVDLDGNTLAPGFIDAHGHFGEYPLLAGLPNVASPPVGPIRTIEELQSTLRAYIEDNDIPAGEWVFSTGYDDSQLTAQRHPNRQDLDAVATTHPIFLGHISGHLAAANSLALELVGFTKGAEDPPGGRIWRDADGEPTGIVDEQAVFAFLGNIVPPTSELIPRFRDASLEFARYGITTAQEGQTQQHTLPLLRAAAAQGHVLIDVVSYPKWSDYQQMLADDPVPIGTYLNHVKTKGVKITLDGSPQGKTAYLSKPYLNPPEGEGADYRGHPIMSQQKLDEWVDGIFARDLQLLLHCNGDACADMMFDAVERAGEQHGNTDRRPVMIHAQTVRVDQLDRMQALGIIPSFFPAHTFFWGDWHRDDVLGAERARNISPTRSAESLGMRYTIHNDAPVVPPNIVFLMHNAVNRTTRSGDVLGPDQRISAESALKAVTIWAAYQHFEEDTKGSIEVGKTADFVILSENPLTVDPGNIRNIEVLQTIKEGKTIFVRD